MHRRDLLTSGLLAASALASRSLAASVPNRDDDAPATPVVLPASPAAVPPLITVIPGTLPIVITAPHGGIVRIPGSAGRTGGVQVTDVNTAELALLLAQRLASKFGLQPAVIIAQFSRKDADANRPAAEAYESDAARPHYEAFHAAVRSVVDRIVKGADGKIRPDARGLLLDIHGQSRVPDAIIRGTQDGRTLSRVMARAGIDAVTGPKSLFGLLKAAGNNVLPSLKPNAPKDDQLDERLFDGGHIVGTYGSHRDDGIDAIQIEIGGQRSNNLLKCARDIADAAEGFYRAYMI